MAGGLVFTVKYSKGHTQNQVDWVMNDFTVLCDILLPKQIIHVWNSFDKVGLFYL